LILILYTFFSGLHCDSLWSVVWLFESQCNPQRAVISYTLQSGLILYSLECLPVPEECLPVPEECLPVPEECLPVPEECLPVPEECLPVPEECLPVPV
jgi:hypothetical protein